jgi:hypothetical protein
MYRIGAASISALGGRRFDHCRPRFAKKKVFGSPQNSAILGGRWER